MLKEVRLVPTKSGEPLGKVSMFVRNPEGTFGADAVLERWTVTELPNSLSIMQALEAERNAALSYQQELFDRVPDVPGS